MLILLLVVTFVLGFIVEGDVALGWGLGQEGIIVSCRKVPLHILLLIVGF